MSERLPHPAEQAITRNYDLQPSESGLIIAQTAEKVNHVYGRNEHPHFEADQPVEKVRGIVETETTLGGKPFIIAERPQQGRVDSSPTAKTDEAQSESKPDQTKEQTANSSASTSSASGSKKPSDEPGETPPKAEKYEPNWTSTTLGTDGAGAPKASKKTERKSVEHEFPNQRKVRYGARKDGKVQLGLEIDESGSVLEFGKYDKTSDLSNRRMIFTDSEGNKIFFRGQYMHTIGKFPEENPRVATTFIGNNLTDLTVGQPLTLANGWKTDLAIDKVEIATEVVDKDANVEAFDNKGYDPFEGAEMLIAAIRRDLMRNRKAGIPTTRQERAIPKRSKRNKWLGALATVALLGGVGAGYIVGSASTSPSRHVRQQKQATVIKTKAPTAPTARASTSPSRHVRQQKQATVIKTKAPTARASTVTLREGENPWTVSEAQLRARGNLHPSQAQIAEYDEQMGDENDHEYSLASSDHRAEHLAVGTKLRLPGSPTSSKR